MCFVPSPALKYLICVCSVYSNSLAPSLILPVRQTWKTGNFLSIKSTQNELRSSRILSFWVHLGFHNKFCAARRRSPMWSAPFICKGSRVRRLPAACHCVNCTTAVCQCYPTLLVRSVWNDCESLELKQVLTPFSTNEFKPERLERLRLFRVSTYQLCYSVNVDLSFLQASAEKHWSCHQKVVRHAVSVNIHWGNLTAVVRADLKKDIKSEEIHRSHCCMKSRPHVFGPIWILPFSLPFHMKGLVTWCQKYIF